MEDTDIIGTKLPKNPKSKKHYKTETSLRYLKIKRYVKSLVDSKIINPAWDENKILRKLIDSIPGLNLIEVCYAFYFVTGRYSRGKMREKLDKLIEKSKIKELPLEPKFENLKFPQDFERVRESLVPKKRGKEKLFFSSLKQMNEFVYLKTLSQYVGSVRGLTPNEQKTFDKQMKKLQSLS